MLVQLGQHFAELGFALPFLCDHGGRRIVHEFLVSELGLGPGQVGGDLLLLLVETRALGVDIEWYDQEVFRKTSTIARQVFPLEIDIDHPRWMPSLKRLQKASADMDRAKKAGGLGGLLGRASAGTRAALAFVSLYTIPAIPNAVPED